jgi:hypothetical protein
MIMSPLYYSVNSTTFLKVGGGFNASIVFRNTGDTNTVYIDGFNVLYWYGPVFMSDTRIKRDIVEINDDDDLN